MIDFQIEKIEPLCRDFGIELDDDKKNKLCKYGNLLLCYNEKINLTAITEPEEVLYKHFYDCLLFFKNAQVKTGAFIIDVGTGAGFPGLVLKIARPDIKLTLLDSLNKRVNFLNAVINELNLENVNAVHARAEEAGKNKIYRENYDIACARAVASLPVLLEYCMPFVKRGGSFIAMKGPSIREEYEQSKNALKVLGGGETEIICENLPGNDKRSFIIVKKISQTPPKYPRISAKISKQPL